jgi:hypothetical protein
VTAEQLVVLALIVAAFAAGWLARGAGGSGEASAAPADDDPATPPAPPTPAPAAPTTPARAAPRARRRLRPAATPAADPAADAARALALAASAYEQAVDRWLDERDSITPAGRAALGELERAVQRLDTACARLDEVDDPLADAAWDALDALREATRHLDAFRNGVALDAATSRALDGIERELAHARAAFEGTRA